MTARERAVRARPRVGMRGLHWGNFIGNLCQSRYPAHFRLEKPDMPTRNVSLTPEQDAFVEGLVKSGEYPNASEAVRDAIRALRQRRREDALKLKALRIQIKA